MTPVELKHTDHRPAHSASAIVLLRTSTVLMFFLSAGHMSGYPWSIEQDAELVHSMRTVDFVFLGAHTSYWNLYFGWGLLIGLMLFTLALILWLLSTVADIAPRPVGVLAAVLSVNCLIGAVLSSLYFFIPPTVLYVVLSATLLAAAIRLWVPAHE